jgi:hypothetical protein
MADRGFVSRVRGLPRGAKALPRSVGLAAGLLSGTSCQAWFVVAAGCYDLPVPRRSVARPQYHTARLS